MNSNIEKSLKLRIKRETTKDKSAKNRTDAITTFKTTNKKSVCVIFIF